MTVHKDRETGRKMHGEHFNFVKMFVQKGRTQQRDMEEEVQWHRLLVNKSVSALREGSSYAME